MRGANMRKAKIRQVAAAASLGIERISVAGKADRGGVQVPLLPLLPVA
jgi:hypothetical protein